MPVKTDIHFLASNGLIEIFNWFVEFAHDKEVCSVH